MSHNIIICKTFIMKKFESKIQLIFLICICIFLFSFQVNSDKHSIKLPWKAAGLTERQAAAHLLSRFTYGAKPGDIDKVEALGLENWFKNQLNASLPDEDLNKRLQSYDALNLTNKEVAEQYPRLPQILKMAEDEGYISKDTLNKEDKERYKDLIKSYMEKKGLKPLRELQRQFVNQKILRVAYSNNQLREVITDFWFNHFNISITKNDCAQFIPAYERDIIRPNVLGKFENILIATAKSTAMLFFLDNFSSSGNNSEFNNPDRDKFKQKLEERMVHGDTAAANRLEKLKERRKGGGLNENYAREVMELHTLGVDGGYTQQDVTNAAKVLTGWTIYPFVDYGPTRQIRKVIERIGEDKLTEKGFVHEGDFLFAANRHDNSEKIVLGKSFHAQNGYEEGMELLKMLAHHASTAKFISHKLAVRFVSDNPPQSLIDKMSKTFLEKNGDIKEVLITMVFSPEFWNKEAVRQKTKSPFELAISAVRCLNADIEKPFVLYNAISKMGQKLYAYQAPTGFPDKAQYWINTGALLNRMNFGLAIAAKRTGGMQIDLLALNNGHEPESPESALSIYSKLLLPERDLNETVKRLTPLLNDPDLENKVSKAASKNDIIESSGTSKMQKTDFEMDGDENMELKGKKSNAFVIGNSVMKDRNMLAQVVGIIIGSPEFQRR